MVYKYIVTHELHESKMVKIYYNTLCEKCFKIEKNIPLLQILWLREQNS